jgi:poly(hydroxyalkanoate) granule-associated protein
MREMTMKEKKAVNAEPATLVDAVAESAQQIWQAGLGAFAKAQQDGGALFDALVRDGAQLHKLTEAFAKDKVPGLSGKVGRLASGSWDRIEKIFEDRVARSLRSLGVPSREEVDALQREIDALKAALENMAPQPAATTRKAARPVAKAPAKAAAAPKRPARASTARGHA